MILNELELVKAKHELWAVILKLNKTEYLFFGGEGDKMCFSSVTK